MVISDPKALSNAALDLADEEQVSFEEDPYKAAAGAHAIALLTDWKEYAELDFERIFEGMQKPAFLFDGRNMLDHDALHALGFEVYSIGKGYKSHLD